MIRAVIFDFYGVLNKEMNPNKELIDYIKTKLKPKYKLGIISNALDNSMYEIIPEKDLNKIFDDIVISHKAGVAKPETEIYKVALRNLDSRADEVVFIDDIEAYCEAARSLGMQAIWYRGVLQMKKELEELLTTVADN